MKKETNAYSILLSGSFSSAKISCIFEMWISQEIGWSSRVLCSVWFLQFFWASHGLFLKLLFYPGATAVLGSEGKLRNSLGKVCSFIKCFTASKWPLLKPSLQGCRDSLLRFCFADWSLKCLLGKRLLQGCLKGKALWKWGPRGEWWGAGCSPGCRREVCTRYPGLLSNLGRARTTRSVAGALPALCEGNYAELPSGC